MTTEEFKSTKQVLELIGLETDEINSYFNITGRGPVLVGELALLANVSEDRGQQIANRLIEVGLVREIPGKKPHYMALPPYVALLSQLSRFKDLVKNLREKTPSEIEDRFQNIGESSSKIQKFDSYLQYIRDLKANLPGKIRSQFDRFEKELEQVEKLYEVKKFILELKDRVPEDVTGEFAKMERQLENIKSEISSAFEKQFRIGALKKFAEKIVSKIIANNFEQISTHFKKRFIETTENTLDQVVGQLASISDTAGEIGTDLSSAFSTIDSRLRDALSDIESRITGIHEDILSAMQELRGLFREEIFSKLQEDILANIVKQLEISEETMKEFWERSKKSSMLSFKDVWFIRSVEGMMAQINDSVSRVKMRLYLIAPKLEQVDVISLSRVASHVNVRISAAFDKNDPEDAAKLREIEAYPNINIRNYPRQNIWAINKDFEEVVVCVVSGLISGEYEIAGMGSILDEHIKLFAGVLEEVWIQSEKAVIMRRYEKVEPTTERIAQLKQERIKAAKSLAKPVTPKIPAPRPKAVAKPVPKPTETKPVRPPPKKKPEKIDKAELIDAEFQRIHAIVGTKTGAEIAKIIIDVKDSLFEKVRLGAVLHEISSYSRTIKTYKSVLPEEMKEELYQKLKEWKNRLLTL